MADTRYLKRRHQSWSFYMAVPVALQGRFVSHAGKPVTKVVVSLHTQSLKEAQDRRWPLVHEWRERFSRAAQDVPLTVQEIDADARQSYQDLLAHMTTIPFDEEALDVALAHDREALGEGDWAYARPFIGRVTARRGIEIEPGSATYKLLAAALLRARIAALEGRQQFMRGEPSEEPTTFLGQEGIDPATLRPIVPLRRPQVRRDDGMAFSEAAARYISEMQRDVGAKLTEHTRGQHESVFRLFTDFTGDASLASISKATASDFLDLIARLDPQWNHIDGAREMPLTELVERCAARSGQLSNRTINRYISHLANVFKWADKRGHFEGRNPFGGQGRKEARGTGWRAYTTDELNKLFGSELFKTATSKERIHPAKQFQVRDVLDTADRFVLWPSLK